MTTGRDTHVSSCNCLDVLQRLVSLLSVLALTLMLSSCAHRHARGSLIAATGATDPKAVHGDASGSSAHSPDAPSVSGSPASGTAAPVSCVPQNGRTTERRGLPLCEDAIASGRERDVVARRSAVDGRVDRSDSDRRIDRGDRGRGTGRADNLQDEPVLPELLFAFDSGELSSTVRNSLRSYALWLNGNDVRIRIEGHTDERGTKEYNLALGRLRAQSAFEFIRSHGVSPTRMQVVSYGEELPVAAGANERSWRRNRRVELAKL